MTHDFSVQLPVERPQCSFGESNDRRPHVFLVNPDADPASQNDFCMNVLGSINELLDDAILADGMSGNRAWLVQHLLGAYVATRSSVTE